MLSALLFDPAGRNVARSSEGATATASSHYSASFPAAAVINGDRHRLQVGGAYNIWHSAAGAPKPDWVEVAFGGAKTVDEVSVFTQQDDYNNPVMPTEGQTFALYGPRRFDVQYWTGSSWATIQGGSVSGNDRVWRRLTFPAVTATKIRVLIHAAAD